MSSAEEFLRAFGPNAESRREGVFLADHSIGSFEMQRHNIGKVRQKRHNIGKVRQKRLTSQNERNACGTKRRQPSVLNEMAQNLHLADARSRQPPCSYCGSCEHAIKRCTVMDRVAFVGKKNTVP
jgi:hypothetical protein